VTKTRSLLMMMLAVGPAALGGLALAAQDRYSLQVPGGLAFADFRGYEDWQVVSVSHNGDKLATILGNSALIEAYRAGIPGNGKPFPDGARFAKIHWTAKKDESQPGEPLVPGPLHDIDFMVKDSKKFADSGGWGYAQFDYDSATETFKPGDENSTPPQEHDAKCGFACHTIVADKDYVFTAYPAR
jgi:Cytochrome P460